MHAIAEQLLKAIRNGRSMRAGDRVAVALSGGADSVALLWLLLELRSGLGIVLSVAHVNHKLRGEESDEDERFVTELAGRHGLEMHACEAPVSSRQVSTDSPFDASTFGSGIEAAARALRYSFFRQLARERRVEKIVTAHTLDDQAETVLLRIVRGTGIRGLSGIHPRIIFEEQGQKIGEVLRPLLGLRRAALQEFLRQRGLSWREDSSNRNVAFLRNRIRHRLLPIIAEEFGEAAIEHMAELAEIARAEEELWKPGHPQIMRPGSDAPFAASVSLEPRPLAALPVQPLLALPLAAQRRMLRAWLESNAPTVAISFRLIEQALQFARTPESRTLELPAGWNLHCSQSRSGPELLLELKSSSNSSEGGDYEYTLAVPGAVEVVELGAYLEARLVEVRKVREGERSQLLDPARLPKQVLIRNWRAGDRYWPAHTAAARKVKQLLSARHATGSGKKLWPVAVVPGFGLVWMRGFAAPAALRAPENATQAIWIREIAPMM